MFHNFFYSFITWWIFELLCLCLLFIFIYKLFFLTSVFYVPKSEIDESYGNSMVNFSRNYQIVFHSDYTILHSYQHCMRILISPHLQQHLFTPFFGYSHPGRCGVVYHYDFDLHFQRLKMLSIFPRAYWPFACLL